MMDRILSLQKLAAASTENFWGMSCSSASTDLKCSSCSDLCRDAAVEA